MEKLSINADDVFYFFFVGFVAVLLSDLELLEDEGFVLFFADDEEPPFELLLLLFVEASSGAFFFFGEEGFEEGLFPFSVVVLSAVPKS